MTTIPLFDAETLAANLKELTPALEKALLDAAEQFVRDNKDDMLVLGDANVKAIFEAQFYASVPIPMLPPEPTAEDIATRETILTKRDAAFVLIARAQKENNERQNRVLKNAGKAATSVGLTIIGLTIKAVLGG